MMGFSNLDRGITFSTDAKVYSIERQAKLFNISNQFLPQIGMGGIRLLLGDGYLGSDRFAPFDKIIVTAGAPTLPDALIKQLNVNGRLVIPVGDSKTQKMAEEASS